MATHHDSKASLDDSTSLHGQAQELESHIGAKKVAVAQKVYGKYSRWLLFLGLGLASYVYSLDGTTTFLYLTFAASSLDEHSLISSVQVAQSIILAIGKPVVAKFADVTSRGTAYIVVLIFYVIGYIVIASAKNVKSIAGGIVIYAVGNTGLQLLTQIVIADITTLKWRGLVSSLVSTPFIINAFVGANIAADVTTHAGWRWGYGMFAILVPVALSPLIAVLLWAERKAKRLGLVPVILEERPSLGRRLLLACQRMDLIGLILLGAALALILVPLTINQTVRDGWHNRSIIAMLVVGCLLLIVFGVWDIKFARYPVVNARFLRNRAIVGASLIGFFDFVSFYLTFTYLYSFVLVVKDWSLVNTNYFTSTQTVALTVFGITAGLLLRIFHRYKVFLTGGLVVRLLGVGIMIHSRGADGSTAELVWAQVIQGIGGGFAAATSQVGAQASVSHADVGIVTALVLLFTEVGGAIGNAIAGAIWSNTMPSNLTKYLPASSQEERDALYASVITVRLSPRGDPTREGVILAYSDTMKIMLIAATAIAIIPAALSFMMPDWFLGDEQNAVTGTDLTGEPVEHREPAKSQIDG